MSGERQKRWRQRHREAWLDKNRERLRAARRADPERFKRYAELWDAKNPERRAEIEARRKEKYANDPLLRKRIVTKAKQWAEANPERRKKIHEEWRKAHPERWSEVTQRAGAAYRKRHPEVLRENETHRKRVKRRPLPWAERKNMREVYRQARARGFEVDHIVPLKHPLVSGLHVWANLQLLDRPLNRRKKNIAWPDMPV